MTLTVEVPEAIADEVHRKIVPLSLAVKRPNVKLENDPSSCLLRRIKASGVPSYDTNELDSGLKICSSLELARPGTVDSHTILIFSPACP